MKLSYKHIKPFPVNHSISKNPTSLISIVSGLATSHQHAFKFIVIMPYHSKFKVDNSAYPFEKQNENKIIWILRFYIFLKLFDKHMQLDDDCQKKRVLRNQASRSLFQQIYINVYFMDIFNTKCRVYANKWLVILIAFKIPPTQ